MCIDHDNTVGGIKRNLANKYKISSDSIQILRNWVLLNENDPATNHQEVVLNAL